MQKTEVNQLFEYCKNGKTQILLKALAKVDDLEIVNERGMTLLSTAFKSGQWQTAQALIDEHCISADETLALIASCQFRKDISEGVIIALSLNPDINVVDKQNRSALMTACLLGHFNKAQELINHNAACHFQDNHGNTALIDAVQSKNIKLIEMLLSQEQDVNLQNHNDESALIVAIKQKEPQEKIINLLLDAGGDPEKVDNSNKSTWLLAKQKHPKIARTIEKHLNNINQIELPIFTNDYTPKDEAKRDPNKNLQNKIFVEKTNKNDNNRIEPSINLEKQTDQNKQSKTYQKKPSSSPFNFKQKKITRSNQQEWFHAAKIGNLGGLNRMIVEGVDINDVDEKGCSALIRACGHSRRAVVSFLLQQNADIELRSKNGSTALSSSIIGNCRRVAGLLLEKGANPNGFGPADYSYATIAAAQWNDAMISILYRHGADVFILNNKNQNLLHIIALAAEFYNNINTAKTSIQFLIDHGMSLDSQDSAGNTPLMILCGIHKNKYNVDDRNIASLVHCILKLGASPAITNANQKAAIDATRLHKLQQTKGVLMNALAWNDA